MDNKIRLGELLVQNNIITQEQLNIALDKRSTEKGKIGRILIKLGFINEETLNFYLAKQFGESASSNTLQANVIALRPHSTTTKLLHLLFEEAMQKHASDIHIEPDAAGELHLRLRIDGALQESVMKRNAVVPALIAQLKLKANLKTDASQLPQEGNFTIKIDNKSIDVCLSVMPLQNGESVVMHLLDRNAEVLQLEQLGMQPAVLKKLRNIMSLPHGMILVAGPVGSGKTTTLYSVLSELNDKSKKIITVENSIKCHLPHVNQVQIDSRAEVSFARVLRTVLHQDPDIIMVGEIGDSETANIALREAINGHFVLAGICTSNTISSVMHLLDASGEGQAVMPALRAVITQRLVRRLCNHCAETYVPNPQEMAWISAVGDGDNLKKKDFRIGRGCQNCNDTGYKGRIGVYELLEFNEDITAALISGNVKKFNKLMQDKGFGILSKAALNLAVQGVISLQEAMKASAG